MISVGLDLSLTASGLARTRAGACVGQLELIGRKLITEMPLDEQIAAIAGLVVGIEEWVGQQQPDVVVLEALDNAQSYGGVTERAALWWLVASAIRDWRVPRLYLPTSAQVKIYATGNGNATKKEVNAAVTRNWPWWAHRGNDNLSDAAAMAELGLALAGHPSLTTMPREHTRVIPAVRSIFDPPSRVVKKAAKKQGGKQ